MMPVKTFLSYVPIILLLLMLHRYTLTSADDLVDCRIPSRENALFEVNREEIRWHYKYEIFENDRVKLKCKDGFDITGGSRYGRCIADENGEGVILPRLGYCDVANDEIVVCKLPSRQNAVFQVNGKEIEWHYDYEINANDRVNLKCEEGFELSGGPQDGSCIVDENREGAIFPPLGYCEREEISATSHKAASPAITPEIIDVSVKYPPTTTPQTRNQEAFIIGITLLLVIVLILVILAVVFNWCDC